MASRDAVHNLPILSDASLLALRTEILADRTTPPVADSDEERLTRVLQDVEREILNRGMVGSPWWAEHVQDAGPQGR